MFTKSIRSKFLLWLGFLLICLLIGFGVTAYKLFCTNQNHQIYEQLQRRLSAMSSDLSGGTRGRPFGGFDGPGRGKFEDGPSQKPPDQADNCDTNSPVQSDGFKQEAGEPKPFRSRHGHFDDFFTPPEPGERRGPPRDEPWGKREPRFEPGGPDAMSSRSEPPVVKLSAEVLDLFDQSNTNAFYFAVWNRAGIERARSSNAPVDLQIVSSVERSSGPQIRAHGEFLESYLQHAVGYRVLVGRSIAPELAARRQFAFWLVAAGGVVLALGLCGGWWLTARALRPVKNISDAATRISAGNLAERINVSETDNELGQLAATLNSSFARLEAAFAQQKQFTADASHELRTPLAVMISEAQTTLARPRNAGEYRETVEACLDTAQQMRKLTESLLELARLDSGQENFQRTPFALDQLVHECATLLKPLAAERNIKIETILMMTPAAGDADRIRQVVTNLISNAIHYNQPGGFVRISTHNNGNEAVLMVEDSGVGIAPEKLPDVFKRFYRADKARARANGNSGLGLAICKAIVDAHGGSIEAASENGKGTRFTVRLPK